jgi:hypothetical protein
VGRHAAAEISHGANRLCSCPRDASRAAIADEDFRYRCRIHSGPPRMSTQTALRVRNVAPSGIFDVQYRISDNAADSLNPAKAWKLRTQIVTTSPGLTRLYKIYMKALCFTDSTKIHGSSIFT